MKRLIIIIITLFCVTPIYSQNANIAYANVQNDLDALFENLNKDKISTGILLDNAVDRIDFSEFDGTTLNEYNNITSLATYINILKSIQSGASVNIHLNSIDALMSIFQHNSNFLDISITAFRYNFIKEDALKDNLIVYNSTTNQVSDSYINGVWQDPYAESIIVASCPNRMAIPTLTATFRTPANFRFTNLNISETRIDTGDGLGYRLISPSSIISASYRNPGQKTLKIKIHTTDGLVLETHSTILVGTALQANYAQMSNSTGPNYKHTFTTTYANRLSDSTRVSAQMSCYYKPGGSSITKPFIVVEGFDPWILAHIDEVHKSDTVNLGFTTHKKGYSDYTTYFNDANEYDFIYIDWNNSLADIRANAQLLIQIIEHINQKKRESFSTEKNVIMGQSMGGLVTRYALRQMEFDAHPHETSTYISHDSPHLGANVPLGALYFIHQMLSFAHGFDNLINIYNLFTRDQLSKAEKNFCSILYGDSVRQMLFNYVAELGTLDNSLHNDWMSILSTRGFPTKTENIAIVNGNFIDKSSILLDGDHFLQIHGPIECTKLTNTLATLIIALGSENTLEFYHLFGSTKINIYAEINPLSATNAVRPISVLDINFTKDFKWLPSRTYTVFSSAIYPPSSTLYYDDYPGSLFNLTDYRLNDTLTDQSSLAKYEINVNITDKIMFIPTASALAIHHNGTATHADYTNDYYNQPPIPGIDTPFDAYYISQKASTHIQLDSSSYPWISQQLNARIEGPDTLMSSTATYIARGFNGPVIWRSSNNTIATIDDTGKLTATGNGLITISAETYSHGEMTRKTKDILIGFPEIAITYSFSPGKGHMFAASISGDGSISALQELVEKGYLNYEWSILCNDGNLTTTISTTPSISHLPLEDETVSVFLRLVDNNGNKGETYSRTINLSNPFSTNYLYVEVDQNGIIKFIKNNGYETGLPSEDFTINFRNIIYTEYDNALNLVSKYLKGNNCYLAYSTGYGNTYLIGTKLGVYLKWTFPFLDSIIFTNALENAIHNASEENLEPGILTDFGLCICNHEKQIMQALPFAIIYKNS